MQSMKYPMKNPEAGLPLTEAQEGMLAGLWYRLLDGFVWRDDLMPASTRYSGPWLVRAGDTREQYPVLKRKNLLQDFARLAEDPSRDGIRRFAGRYGWLGLEQPVVSSPAGGPLQWAEPLSLWRQELLAIRDLWETWGALRTLEHKESEGPTACRAARRRLEERIQWGQDGSIIYRATVTCPESIRFPAGGGKCPECGDSLATHVHFRRVIAFPRGYARGREATRSFDPDDPLGPARAYLTQEVNRRLRGHVHLTLGSFQDSPIRFFPDSLLAAIYLRFALELAGRSARERECEFCHMPFPVGRRDQRFCSKSCRENAGYHRRREEKTVSSATSGRSAVDQVSVSRPE